eukprot:931097-Rhodomonas_salina.1
MGRTFLLHFIVSAIALAAAFEYLVRRRSRQEEDYASGSAEEAAARGAEDKALELRMASPPRAGEDRLGLGLLLEEVREEQSESIDCRPRPPL